MTMGTSLRDVLELEQVGEGLYRGQNFTAGLGGVVFGGQLLAQTIVAAGLSDPSKNVKTVHTIFARGGALDQPLDIEVDTMHSGRARGSVTVTIRQGERLCTRALVLLSVDEPDLIRFSDPMPEVGGPLDAHSSGGEGDFWDIRIVDGVDISDAEAVGPPELDVWTRFPGPPSEGALGQALLAYATDGFLIGTAMRPHAGIGQSMAHVSISTSVLSHTLTFHEPVDASQWHLISHSSPHAGRGRSYGRADIFSEEGHIVASFVQDNMIRSFPKEQQPKAGEHSKF